MNFLDKRHVKMKYYVTASVNNEINLETIVNICKNNNNFYIKHLMKSYLIIQFNYNKCIYQMTIKKFSIFITINKYNDINLIFMLIGKIFNIVPIITDIKYKGCVRFNNIEGNFNNDNINVIRKIHTYIDYNYDKYARAVLFQHGTVFIQGQSYDTLEEIYKHLYARLTLPSVLKILFNYNSYFSLLPYELSDVILSFT